MENAKRQETWAPNGHVGTINGHTHVSKQNHAQNGMNAVTKLTRSYKFMVNV